MNKIKIMIKKALFLLFVATFIATSQLDACTNFLITKGASANGSTMVSYAADSHGLYGELYFLKAANHKPGSLRDIHDWDTGKYLGQIPQVPHTYQRVGNMNEMGLVIGETTYGGRGLEDADAIMDYGSLIYVALERAATAREAIAVIVDLANTYGYYSEGESFSLADKDEVWIMELIGKGGAANTKTANNKGIVWVARRVPEGYICGHANQARITTFPQNDPENCLFAPDVISFAREMGYYEGSDADFSFADAYAPLDFSGMRGCDARAWSGFNILCDGQFTYEDANGNEITRPATDFEDYALGHNKANRFPLWVKPSRKITPLDVANVMRDHYEGTALDMTQDIGAGGNALPYRWRPMTFEVDGKTYTNERAIATQQTGFWFVGEVRGDLPEVLRPLLWFSCDDAATAPLMPVYVCSTACPDCVREGNGALLEYSSTSFFWATNRVANACYKMYNHMAGEVRTVINEWENAKITEVAANDAAWSAISAKAAKRAATKYTLATAAALQEKWVRLDEHLLVKYMDGNVKEGDKILHPDYTELWKRTVVKETGDHLQVVE